MLRSEFSLAEVGRANLNFDYLKGVYARDVGGVLRKIAVLNSSSILDLGQDLAGLEVPVIIHGTDAAGLEIRAADTSTKSIKMYHDDTQGVITTSAGQLHLNASDGGKFVVGATAGYTYQVSVGTGCQLILGAFATAAAPAEIEGGCYYDLTLHKLRIRGAAGYETVTSA